MFSYAYCADHCSGELAGPRSPSTDKLAISRKQSTVKSVVHLDSRSVFVKHLMALSFVSCPTMRVEAYVKTPL